MDNNQLKEIRNDIRALPILEERYNTIFHKLAEAEDTLRQLKGKYEQETHDVDKLMEASFAVSLLQFIGKYEGKLSKEQQEELQAKAEYDKASDRVSQLKSERDELSKRILQLKNNSKLYETELNHRAAQTEKNSNSTIYKRYFEIENKLDFLAKQLVETEKPFVLPAGCSLPLKAH